MYTSFLPSSFRPLGLAGLIALLSTAPASGQPATANPFPGTWSGATQFQMSVGGKYDAAAHSVAELTLTLSANGRVTGSAPENGCRLLGVTTPGFSGVTINLDVTLTGCRHGAYNRRFNGLLTWSGQSQTGVLNLTSTQMSLGKAESFDIKGTLRK